MPLKKLHVCNDIFNGIKNSRKEACAGGDVWEMSVSGLTQCCQSEMGKDGLTARLTKEAANCHQKKIGTEKCMTKDQATKKRETERSA